MDRILLRRGRILIILRMKASREKEEGHSGERHSIRMYTRGIVERSCVERSDGDFRERYCGCNDVSLRCRKNAAKTRGNRVTLCKALFTRFFFFNELGKRCIVFFQIHGGNEVTVGRQSASKQFTSLV